jgi:hypothetical protein
MGAWGNGRRWEEEKEEEGRAHEPDSCRLLCGVLLRDLADPHAIRRNRNIIPPSPASSIIIVFASFRPPSTTSKSLSVTVSPSPDPFTYPKQHRSGIYLSNPVRHPHVPVLHLGHYCRHALPTSAERPTFVVPRHRHRPLPNNRDIQTVWTNLHPRSFQCVESAVSVFYPLYVFIAGVIGVGCVLGLGVGWAGKMFLDIIFGRKRRSTGRRRSIVGSRSHAPGSRLSQPESPSQSFRRKALTPSSGEERELIRTPKNTFQPLEEEEDEDDIQYVSERYIGGNIRNKSSYGGSRESQVVGLRQRGARGSTSVR